MLKTRKIGNATYISLKSIKYFFNADGSIEADNLDELVFDLKTNHLT